MNEYTKGIWKFNMLNDLGIEGDSESICHITRRANVDESEANAQLIAQSPRMAEFIKNIGLHIAVNYDEENEPYFIIDKEYLAEAHTIIAKVEGK